MGSIGNATNYLQKVLAKDPKNKDAQNDVSSCDQVWVPHAHFVNNQSLNLQLRTVRMVQEYESSAFQAHDKEDYRKVINSCVCICNSNSTLSVETEILLCVQEICHW